MPNRIVQTFAAAAALLAALPAAAGVPVRLDGSTRVALSRPARDIVVANPSIADVQMLSERSLVVIGKSYGSTTLLVVDRAGRTVLDETIVVGSGDGDHVAYFRGGQVQNYSCSPRCERTAMAGESESVFSPVNGPANSYMERARGAGSGGGGASGGGQPTVQPGQ